MNILLKKKRYIGELENQKDHLFFEPYLIDFIVGENCQILKIWQFYHSKKSILE